MLIKGTLRNHLADPNEQAEDMFFRLVKDMAKAENHLKRIVQITNLHARATEIVNSELIFV